MLPAKTVVLLSGDGGAGKSTLALQLMLACTTGNQWLGLDVEQGPVLYLSAEDRIEIIHHRVAEICEAEGIDLAEAHTGEVLPMAGEVSVLAYEKQGRMEVTPLYREIAALLSSSSPLILILDNLADVFAGNENNRSLAKQFIGYLTGLAIRFDCVIVLLAHPSLSGLTSGSGSSGSTAWNNSARGRLYLHKGTGLDAEDSSKRILEVMKANYGPSGTRINLGYAKGRFVRVEPVDPWARVAKGDLERVKERFASGQWRCSDKAQDWGGYAVAEVLGVDVGRDLSKAMRSPPQEKARQDVMVYLRGWERNGDIIRVAGVDARREPTFYYGIRGQEEGDE